MLYGNIEHAYKTRCRPPIGKSDHNGIHLLPKYRQLVKHERPIVKTVQVWNGETLDKLKSAIETKRVVIFPNNKSWLSKDLKTCLNEKKMAFLRGDTEMVRDIRKELREKMQKAQMDLNNKQGGTILHKQP